MSCRPTTRPISREESLSMMVTTPSVCTDAIASASMAIVPA